MKNLALSAVLSAVLLSLASAADAALTISKLQGEISVKTSRGVITVKGGDPIPDIPEGAQITVVSGQATFEAGGVVISAGAGSGFRYAEGKGGVQISASAGTVSVAAGKSLAALAAGSAVAVDASGKDTVVIAVTAGEVPVTTDGKTETIPAGKFTSSAKPAPAPAKTETSKDKKEKAKSDSKEKSSDSLPATNTNTSTSSPLQETTTSSCDDTVSPSSPCE